MPEDPPIGNRIARALATQIHKPCPLCQNKQWITLQQDDLLERYRLRAPDSDTPEDALVLDPEGGFPAYGFVCTECGLVRFHALVTLMRDIGNPA